MKYNFDLPPDRRDSECAKWNIFDEDVLPLPVADMDFVSPQPVLDALQERVAHGIFGYPKISYDCRSTLMVKLYSVILKRLQDLYGWSVEPDELVFFPGVVAGLNMACKAFGGSDVGVLVQPPVYPPFLHLAKNSGSIYQEAPLMALPDGRYEIDWDTFESAITPQTKIFVLCNPHNPVGRVFRRDELEKMAEVCLAHDIKIVSDEIHCDLLFDDHHHIPIASLDEQVSQNTITLMAPSKTYNLAGLYFSFGVIKDPEIRKQFIASRGGILGGINIMGLTAAEAAYRGGQEWLDQVLAYMQANRNYLVDFIRQYLPGVKVVAPEGTYLAWLDCREAGIPGDPYDFFLGKARVGLNKGTYFGKSGTGFVRLNFACSRSLLVEALERMKAALD